MPEELLLAAIEQADRSDPAVQGIALLHIARVMAAVDKAEAKRLMESGLAVIERLPEDHRSILLNEAVSLAGTVSPERAFELIPLLPDRPGRIDKLIFDLLSHGYITDAVGYLTDPYRKWDYPFLAATNAMSDCRNDPESQARILRAAADAVFDPKQSNFMGQTHFVQLFNRYWRLLPASEAEMVVRRLVEKILQDPDQRGNMNSGGPAGQVHFSSTQQWRLFEILGPLRSLIPALAYSLVGQFDQLAEAARTVPNGYEEPGNTSPGAESDDAPKPGVDIEWDDVNFKWIPMSEWLEQIFPLKFEAALQLYHSDVTPSPSQAPKECWPSTQAFRELLYQSGRYQGKAAAKHLDRIPDPDLRLFAQIELCAASAGLCQIGGSSIQRRSEESEQPKLSISMITAESAVWEGKGRPRQVRIDMALWVPEERAWGAPVRTFVAAYREDGQASRMERRIPDNSVVQCEFDYDERGRPAAIWSMVESGPVEQIIYSYNDAGRSVHLAKAGTTAPASAAPASAHSLSGGGFSVNSVWVTVNARDDSYEIGGTTAMTTKYDEQNHPVENLYYGSDGHLLARKTLVWDRRGFLMADELTLAFGEMLGLDSMPEWKTTYDYDEDGRCRERRRRLGPDFEVRTTFVRDTYGNVVEMMDTGQSPVKDSRHLRYEYRFDDQGNWIERVTLQRADSDFLPVSKEERYIEYR